MTTIKQTTGFLGVTEDAITEKTTKNRHQGQTWDFQPITSWWRIGTVQSRWQ
ncbi:MAG: hypothetical protein P8J32_03790 [bacterium]|nr:hypothetical protein [bacterium]